MIKNKNKIGIAINSELSKEDVLRIVMTYSEIFKSNHYPKLWAEKLRPIEGEALSSWITRISLANLEKTSSLTGEVGCYPSLVDLDLNWIPELVQFFSTKTEVSEHELLKMSLCELKEEVIKTTKHYDSISVVKNLWFTGWRSRAKNGLRLCPLCLRKDKTPFFRKVWRLSYIPICMDHDCFLVNKCPKCDSPIAPYELKWDSKLTECFNCGFNLTQSTTEIIPKSDSLLTHFLELNCENIDGLHKILALAWFIANHCSFLDDFFENHPLIKTETIKNMEKDNLENPNKKMYFTNLFTSYLLIGTATKIYRNKELLDLFLERFYSSIDLFWTKTPHICPEADCDFTETSYARMEIHLKRHNDERLYYCEKCNKNFVTKWDYENHRKLHDELHPFKCLVKECKQEFRHKKQYIRHLRLDHDIKPYACPICNKRFDRRYNLNTHIRSHTGEKPYKCEECGKKFTQKSELNVHIKIHSGEKPYICKICRKGFTQSHSLTEHFRIHTNDKPYACPRCEKRFKRKHHLDVHLRTHTGEKPFKCEICEKPFSNKGNLKKHMVSHSEERPYVCVVCGKSYKYSSGLSKHKKENPCGNIKKK